MPDISELSDRFFSLVGCHFRHFRCFRHSRLKCFRLLTDISDMFSEIADGRAGAQNPLKLHLILLAMCCMQAGLTPAKAHSSVSLPNIADKASWA